MALDWLCPAPALPAWCRDGLSLREAAAAEMDAVYLMGRDAWGDGCGVAEYLRLCRDSRKYRRGRWHVLTAADGGLLCAAIAYRLPSLAGRLTLGLGSLATAPEARGRGHASLVLNGLLQAYRRHCRAEVFLLFADIDLRFYQRLGFLPLPAALQPRADAVGMALCAPELWEPSMRALAERPLGYF